MDGHPGYRHAPRGCPWPWGIPSYRGTVFNWTPTRGLTRRSRERLTRFARLWKSATFGWRTDNWGRVIGSVVGKSPITGRTGSPHFPTKFPIDANAWKANGAGECPSRFLPAHVGSESHRDAAGPVITDPDPSLRDCPRTRAPSGNSISSVWRPTSRSRAAIHALHSDSSSASTASSPSDPRSHFSIQGRMRLRQAS